MLCFAPDLVINEYVRRPWAPRVESQDGWGGGGGGIDQDLDQDQDCKNMSPIRDQDHVALIIWIG